MILPHRQVVSIERDIQLPDRHLRAFDIADAFHQSMGQMHAPGADPDERQSFGAFIPL